MSTRSGHDASSDDELVSETSKPNAAQAAAQAQAAPDTVPVSQHETITFGGNSDSEEEFSDEQTLIAGRDTQQPKEERTYPVICLATCALVFLCIFVGFIAQKLYRGIAYGGDSSTVGNVISSPNDDRSFEYMKLDNGLQVRSHTAAHVAPSSCVRDVYVIMCMRERHWGGNACAHFLHNTLSPLYFLSSARLQVLIVSDPDADRSGAALDVSVGAMSDPIEYQGLAHGVEHCLFLGALVRELLCVAAFGSGFSLLYVPCSEASRYRYHETSALTFTTSCIQRLLML